MNEIFQPILLLSHQKHVRSLAHSPYHMRRVVGGSCVADVWVGRHCRQQPLAIVRAPEQPHGNDAHAVRIQSIWQGRLKTSLIPIMRWPGNCESDTAFAWAQLWQVMLQRDNREKTVQRMNAIWDAHGCAYI